MKRKGLRVIRKGTVLEGELPKTLQRQGPKWLKSWPKVRLNRGRSKEKSEGNRSQSTGFRSIRFWIDLQGARGGEETLPGIGGAV
jgi:hypothetical protein